MKSREQIEKMYFNILDKIKFHEKYFHEETIEQYREEIRCVISELRSNLSLLREILDG